MVREVPPQPAPYPAEKMRRDKAMQRPQRATFIAAVAVLVIVVVLLVIWG